MERQRFVDFSLTLNHDLGYFVIGRRQRRTFLTFFDEVSGLKAIVSWLFSCAENNSIVYTFVSLETTTRST